MLRDALEDRYEVEEACDGREAIQKIAANKPDVALLDIAMPFLDGYEVLRSVRADAALAGVRTVALTAFAMQSDRDRALEAGFDAYVSKPVELKALRQTVARLAGG
jgi:CheY-like chemotaxis protein